MSIKQGGNTIAGAVGKYPLNERNISNCITEIPQDIKLELNNGTLTLKAGSKVYVPNGAGVFDEVVIASDLSVTPTWLHNNTGVVFYYLAENRITATETSYCMSGSTEPTYLDGGCWYDTTNNKIKKGTSSSWTDTQKISLPIAVVKSSSNSITSIDQTFNGFGYVGSTTFVLPGVKGLIPNGRNADGSLKSIEFTVNNVLTSTQQYAQTSPHYIVLNANTLAEWDSVYWMGYNADKNIVYNKNGSASATTGEKVNVCICGVAEHIGTTKITSFTPKTAFHAVDYIDTEYMAHQSMPSNRYVDLTLGAKGSTYTAPADGYVAFCKQSSGANQNVNIQANDMMEINWAAGSEWNLSVNMPVKKGDIFVVSYTTGNATQWFRFIYAKGAQ